MGEFSSGGGGVDGGVGDEKNVTKGRKKGKKEPRVESQATSMLPNYRIGDEDLGDKGFDLVELYNVGTR